MQLGPKWIDSIPKDVGGTQKSPQNGHNPLYDFDFITINDLLFKDYPSKQIDSSVLKEIQQGKISPDDIKSYIPTSNWERYFSTLVECESEYLQKRWKKLYELRNKIAHNKQFTKIDLDEVRKISEEVKSKLTPALDKISSIKIPEIPLPVSEQMDIIEGDLCRNDLIPTSPKTDGVASGSIGTIATGALIGAFLASLTRS